MFAARKFDQKPGRPTDRRYIESQNIERKKKNSIS